MKNFKLPKFRRAAALVMSAMLSITTLFSDAALLKATAAGLAGPAPAPNPVASDISTVTNGTGKDVSVTKKAVLNNNGTVTITFDVKNNTDVQPVTTSNAAEIVFVMDTSGSMADNQKLNSAKQAAKNFAKSIFDANKNSNIKVAIVPFSASAKKGTLRDNYAAVEREINGLTADGGTDIQEALQKAQETFSKENNKKIMVVLSDGAPTNSYKGTKAGNIITLNTGENVVSLSTFSKDKAGTDTNYGFITEYKDGTYTLQDTYYSLNINLNRWVDVVTNSVVDSNKVYKNWSWNPYDGQVSVDTTSHKSIKVTSIQKNNGAKSYGYFDEGGAWRTYYYDAYAKKHDLYSWNYNHSYDAYREVVYNRVRVSNNGLATISEAQKIKDAGVEIYTISYGVNNDEKAYAEYVMKNVATNLAHFSSSSATADSIKAVVDSITTKINDAIALAHGTTITDSFPAYMTVTSATAQKKTGKDPIQPVKSNDGKSVVWELGQADDATMTITATIDWDKAISSPEQYKNGAELKLNDSVTIEYFDKNNKPKEDKSIKEGNVPKTVVYTYPYTITYKYGEETLKTVSSYAIDKKVVSIPSLTDAGIANADKYLVDGKTLNGAKLTENSFAVSKNSKNEVVVNLVDKKHTVTFIGYDATKPVDVLTVNHGESVSPTALKTVEDKITVKPGDEFKGWTSKGYENVTSDVTVYANIITKKFTVSYRVLVQDAVNGEYKLDSDKSYTDPAEYKYGETADVPASVKNLPAEIDKEDFVLRKGQWTLNDQAVTLGDKVTFGESNLVYNLNYTAVAKYVVTFTFVPADTNANTTPWTTKKVSGSAIEASDIPDYTSCKATPDNHYYYDYEIVYADGSDFNVGDTVSGTTNILIKEIAKVQKHTVTFKFAVDGVVDETRTKTSQVAWGESPEYPEMGKVAEHPEYYNYAWDKNLETVTGPGEVYTYNASLKTFKVSLTIHYVYDDGKTKDVPYNGFDKKVVNAGETIEGLNDLTKIESVTGHHLADDFKWGWKASYVAGTDFTGDQSLVTVVNYSLDKHTVKYTVVTVDENNETVSTDTVTKDDVDYGSRLTATSAFESAPTEKYSYEIGATWFMNGAEVSSDYVVTDDTTDVTVTQVRKINKYTVNFVVKYVEADGVTEYDEANAETIASRSIAYDTVLTSEDMPTLTKSAEWYALNQEHAMNPDNKVNEPGEYKYTIGTWDAIGKTVDEKGLTATIVVKREKNVFHVILTDATGDTPKTYPDYTGVYGETFEFPAFVQTRSKDDTYTYTYAGSEEWKPGTTREFTKNESFEAKYDGTYINYTVTFVVGTKFNDTAYGTNGVKTVSQQFHFDDTVDTAKVLGDILKDYPINDTDALRYTYTKPAFADTYAVSADSNANVHSADWTRTPNKFNVTFIVKGVAEPALPTDYNGDLPDRGDATPDSGEHFVKWIWHKNTADGEEIDKPATMPDYDLVAVAVFAPNTYKVVFKGEFGEETREFEGTSATITDGDKPEFNGSTEVSGWHFLGWDVDHYDYDNNEFETVTGLTDKAEVVITAKYGAVKTLSMTDSTDNKYDGTKKSITATTNDFGADDTINYSYKKGEDAALATNEGVIDAGTYTVTASADYIYNAPNGTPKTFTAIASATLVIAKRDVTLTSDSASKTYNGAPLTAETVTVSGDGFVDGDVVSYKATGSVTNATVTPVENTVEYVLADGKADNYNINVVTGTLTVDRKPVTITAQSYTRVFGDADPVFGIVNPAAQLIDGDELYFTVTRAAGENVGTYALTLTVPETADATKYANGNYDVTAVNGTLTITQRTVTVRGNDYTKNAGDPDPGFYGTVINAVDLDPLTVFFWRLDGGEEPGDKTITNTLRGHEAEHPNYNIVFEDGTLTILAVDNGDQQGNPPANNPNPPEETNEEETTNENTGDTGTEEPPVVEDQGSENVNINEEGPALAAGPANADIPEEEVPLANMTNGWVLWVLLLLIAGYCTYFGFREHDNKKQLTAFIKKN